MIKFRFFSNLEAREVAVFKTEIYSARSLSGSVAIAAIAFLTAGLSGCGSESKAFSSTAAPLISPASVEFGDVTVGTAASKSVSITNSGSSALQITELSSSDSSFAVSSAKLPATLAAGQTLTVKVQYNAKTTADSTGDLSLTSMSTLSNTSKFSSIKLHGKGSNGGTASLSSLSCASSSYIGAGSDNCTVKLSAVAPSAGVVVNLASSSSAVAVPASVTVASGSTSASFAATVSAVTASQTVTLTATQGSTTKTTSIKLSGSSSGVAPSVSALTCGKSAFTGSGSTSCTVTLSGAALSGGQSIAVASSSSALTVPASVTVAAGASTASFNAAASTVTSSQTATVSATANASSKSFAITLNAAVPALSLSATSLSFGNVSVGTAVTKSVTLTSSGTVAVTINSDSISGSGFTVSGGAFPITLNPGQAAVLSVQFYPTAASSVTGQLVISSNAPSAAISLSGTGTSVAPTVSSISCGSTSITGSLSDSCSVSLSGSAPTGGLTVALGSSSSSVTVPASVSVPAAATSTSFTAKVAAVTTAQSATLTATSGSSSKSVSLQLNAATPAISVNASSISFGAIVVNNSTTQTVTISSTGTAALTVNSIGVTGSGFSASAVSLPATLNPGQSISVTLTFNPTVVGSATGQFTVSSNSSTNSSIAIGLSGTANPHQVNLAWSAPSSSGVTITGYKVYRAISGGGFAALNSANPQTSYSDTSVQSGTSYQYYVTSVDSTGVESSPSNTTSAAIP